MKALIALIITLTICSVSNAQAIKAVKPDYSQFSSRETDAMTDRLQLDSSQKKKVAAINKTYFNKLNLVRESKDSVSIRQQKVAALDQEKIAAYKLVLTKEQLARYEADIESTRRQFQQRTEEQRRKQQEAYQKRDSAAVRH